MVQVKLDLKILFFLLIFHFTGQIKIYILLMIFAFIHEMGHLAIGMILGYKLHIFEIKPIGFSIVFHEKEENSRKLWKVNVKQILIILAGPLTNIAIAIGTYLLNAKEEIIYANLVIAFVNLLPIYPLDGGRIIKNVMEICFGNKKSKLYIYRISWITMIMILAVSSFVVLKVRNFALLMMILYMFFVQIKTNLNRP